MLKKVGGMYVDVSEVAAIDVGIVEDETTGEDVGHPILVLKSGYKLILPVNYSLEAIEKGMEMLMMEVEVVH